ncbi:MAG: hypothetical protein IPP35_05020 [Elusimicrobia bacterium]|nr:hypothetical protein [Elusimicrobiota bacterium]
MGAGDRLRFFLEYLSLRALHFLLGRLPAFPGRGVGRALGRAVGLVARKRTRVASENLALAFPEESPSRIRAWTRAVWSDLGAGIWEFARLGRLTAEEFQKEVRVIGENIFSRPTPREKAWFSSRDTWAIGNTPPGRPPSRGFRCPPSPEE